MQITIMIVKKQFNLNGIFAVLLLMLRISQITEMPRHNRRGRKDGRANLCSFGKNRVDTPSIPVFIAFQQTGSDQGLVCLDTVRTKQRTVEIIRTCESNFYRIAEKYTNSTRIKKKKNIINTNDCVTYQHLKMQFTIMITNSLNKR